MHHCMAIEALCGQGELRWELKKDNNNNNKPILLWHCALVIAAECLDPISVRSAVEVLRFRCHSYACHIPHFRMTNIPVDIWKLSRARAEQRTTLALGNDMLRTPPSFALRTHRLTRTSKCNTNKSAQHTEQINEYFIFECDLCDSKVSSSQAVHISHNNVFILADEPS